MDDSKISPSNITSNGDDQAMEVETDGDNSDSSQRRRFLVELEFVQALANPQYLNFLAQHGYLRDSAFINYLDYLQYWKQQEYVKFVKYPQCLHFLELLQSEHFRRELINNPCAKFIEEQQILHWQFNTQNKIKAVVEAARQIKPDNEKKQNQYNETVIER